MKCCVSLEKKRWVEILSDERFPENSLEAQRVLGLEGGNGEKVAFC